MAPRIGLALIAKDEEATLPTLLASVAGAFDRVVLVDTGSTDRTLEIFEQWAQAEAQGQGEGFTWDVGRFDWIDDFAAARTQADNLLTGGERRLVDWLTWADCDDELHGAMNLRPLAAQAPPELAAYMADYEYAHDEHGNCFPGDTEVYGLSPEASTARWYDGEIVEILLASGGQLRVTPNHPILTPEGWIPAGLLDEHCRVVRGGFRQLLAGGTPDEYQRPAAIEDVARAVGEPGGVFARSVPTATEDFHGDGEGSEVHVVRANGLLANAFDTAGGEHDSEPVLKGGRVQHPVLAGAGAGLSSGHAVALTPSRGVGNLDSLSADWVEELLRFVQSADGDASALESSPDGAPVDPEAIRKALRRFAGQVSTDDVVRVERQTFSGHVYNLQTSEGWYVANGVVVHNCVCVLRRERLVRAGHGTWGGRVHEAQAVNGPVQLLDPQLARWIHRKPPTVEQSSDRNVRILTAWEHDEPDNPRVLAYLGTENLARGRFTEAEPFFHRYLALKTGWDEERAQVHRKLAVCLMSQGDLDGAEQVALQALTVLPDWPDSYLSLAQVAHERRDWARCEAWARRVIDLGMPDTMLIINPLEYTFVPRMVLASALGGQMRVEEAAEAGMEALAMVPGHPDLVQGMERWRAETKRRHTAASVVGLAQLLVAHDEQAKALALLEDAVPYYVVDDPQVVAMRSALRERIGPLLTADGQAEHYLAATELGIPEEHTASVVPMLSRAGFLKAGILEQAQIAA